MNENTNEIRVESEEIVPVEASVEAEVQESAEPIYYAAGTPEQNGSNGTDENAGKGVGIASFVLGILAVAFGCCCCCDLVFAIPALICAIIGICKRKHNGFAIAGLILSIVSFIVMTVCGVYFLSVDNDYYYNSYEEEQGAFDEYSEYGEFYEMLDQFMDEFEQSV